MEKSVRENRAKKCPLSNAKVFKKKQRREFEHVFDFNLCVTGKKYNFM